MSDKIFPSRTNRRSFFEKTGLTVVSALAAAAAGLPQKALAQTKNVVREAGLPFLRRRAVKAAHIKYQAALTEFNLTPYRHATNGDELRYPHKIASFSKTLPHNQLGEVDLYAFTQLQTAMETGQARDFESIALGGVTKLANPQAALAFCAEGPDSFALTMPPPPAFSDEETAAEIAEVYWQAVTRDISFAAFTSDPLIAEAVRDLNRFARFSGITANSIFRGETTGDLTGPYISQFLYKPVPSGAQIIDQRYRVPAAGLDFMTSYAEWLNVQNGLRPSAVLSLEAPPRYIRNGRDLGEYVHQDYSFQAYLNAALILLGFGPDALSDANPYKTSLNQSGFVQFGAPHILDMVSRAGNAGLKAAWCQKWGIHRRMRPEVFAGRIHNHLTGAADYPLHPKILKSPVLGKIFSQHGSYLLPMAFPEGSPTHPAYPAGHATIAGACVTMLKAFFKDDYKVPEPVTASEDGLALQAFAGTLTVGGELNKLAANISFGRDAAGVHWRSDGIEGIRLGEAVAIGILRCYKETYNESFAGFSLKKFDGTTVTI